MIRYITEDLEISSDDSAEEYMKTKYCVKFLFIKGVY